MKAAFNSINLFYGFKFMLLILKPNDITSQVILIESRDKLITVVSASASSLFLCPTLSQGTLFKNWFIQIATNSNSFTVCLVISGYYSNKLIQKAERIAEIVASKSTTLDV